MTENVYSYLRFGISKKYFTIREGKKVEKYY